MATQQQGSEQTKSEAKPEVKSEQTTGRQPIQRRPSGYAPVRSGPYSGPFSLMRRFREDVDRLFNNVFTSGALQMDLSERSEGWKLGRNTFWPEIEVHQAGDKLVVQADVPGLRREDINVDVRDHELCISGERRDESEGHEGGYYRTERSYGSFYRVIPLPQGAKADTASATFDNGVLKVEIEAPGTGQSQGRRIEVRQGSAH